MSARRMDRRGFFAAIGGVLRPGEPRSGEGKTPETPADRLGDLSGDLWRIQAEALGIDPDAAGRDDVQRALEKALAAQRPPGSDPDPASAS
ncbi:MAG: hypothetical protein AB1916_02775 [Thermodesulfobacteriota bacterium]